MPNAQGMTTVTICITKVEKKALKQLALDRDVTVSDLFRTWLRESTGLDGEGAGCAEGGES